MLQPSQSGFKQVTHLSSRVACGTWLHFEHEPFTPNIIAWKTQPPV